MTTAFADLDELIERVRDSKARSHFSEAVQAYNARAYRAAVVSLWTAVVFDVYAKLSELGLAGVAGATKFIENYKDAVSKEDWKKVLTIEKTILEKARVDFELITAAEAEDLGRIQRDRNRCAHVALDDNDELFVPHAELVRAHLRCAVERLLCFAPAQSVKAAEGVLHAINDPFFPTAVDDVRSSLRERFLSHPKDSFVRSLSILLVKNLLLEDLEAKDRRKKGSPHVDVGRSAR